MSGILKELKKVPMRKATSNTFQTLKAQDIQSREDFPPPSLFLPSSVSNVGGKNGKWMGKVDHVPFPCLPWNPSFRPGTFESENEHYLYLQGYLKYLLLLKIVLF
jgi:hypothetical protein